MALIFKLALLVASLFYLVIALVCVLAICLIGILTLARKVGEGPTYSDSGFPVL